MEEDVRLPTSERLGGPHLDPDQCPSTTCSLKLHQELPKSTRPRLEKQALSPFARLPRTVIEQ